jgi:prepilin-type processing-associated H-X9-DG protein
LVELLVVVTIISMLAALLLPAVMSARGRARIAQCVNNQKELGLAILHFESAKGRLPGYRNTVVDKTVVGTPVSTAVSWVPVLLPYLGRSDLWEDTTQGWRSFASGAAVAPPKISGLICPDDSSTTANTQVTYVVNSASNRPVDPPGTIAGLFRDCYYGPSTTPSNQPAAGSIVRLTDVHTPSRTILLSENEVVRNWSLSATDGNVAASALTPAAFGFTGWDYATGSTTPIITITNGLGQNTTVTPPSSIHAGIVNVTFCDGHVESLSDDAQCGTYSVVP